MSVDPMEYIWDKLPKEKDLNGNDYIEYVTTDLPYLYENGFVDTQKYTLDEWLIAIIAFKNDETGTYQLNREQFLSLRVFRYDGQLRAPFEPMRIREGNWTEEELWKLFVLSIKPSSTLSDQQFAGMIESAKKKGLFVNGQFRVDRPFKVRLNQIVQENPSPLRKLELRVAERRREQDSSTLKKESSKFTVGKTKAETTSKAFADLLMKR